MARKPKIVLSEAVQAKCEEARLDGYNAFKNKVRTHNAPFYSPVVQAFLRTRPTHDEHMAVMDAYIAGWTAAVREDHAPILSKAISSITVSGDPS